MLPVKVVQAGVEPGGPVFAVTDRWPRFACNTVVMTQQDLNPYRPPDSAPAKTGTTLQADAQRAVLLAVISAALGYGIFMLMLTTRGNGGDLTAGLMLGINIPVLFTWVVLLLRKSPYAARLGLVAFGCQIGILFMMLGMDDVDVMAVLGINGTIAAGFLVLAAFCDQTSDHRRSGRPPLTR